MSAGATLVLPLLSIAWDNVSQTVVLKVKIVFR